PLVIHHQPQRYRQHVPLVQLCHVSAGRRFRPGDSRGIIPARITNRRPELLQSDDYHARSGDGIRCSLPAFVGLANWMVPMMIGAPDMALPRMNNWSFWILPFAFAMLTSTLFMEGGAPNFGWTFYAPLST